MIALIAIMFIEYRRFGDLMAASVIYPVMWVCSIIGLLFSGNAIWKVRMITFLVIIFGYILFCLGFHFIYSKLEKQEVISQEKPNTVFQPGGIGNNMIVAIAVVIGIVYAASLWKYVDISHLYESWTELHNKVEWGQVELPYILVAARYYHRCAIWYVCLCLFKTFRDSAQSRNKIKAVSRLILILMSALPIIFYDFSRNDILFVCLPVLFEAFLIFKTSNRKIVVKVIAAFLCFVIFFLWYIRFEVGAFDGLHELQADSFLLYLSGPVRGLDTCMETGILKLFTIHGGMGRYTFSAIGGLLGRVTGTDIAPYVVLESQQIGADKWINVFTVYHWTAQDFGMIYAMLMQAVIGVLYGKLYYGTKGSDVCVYWYSVLSYSLVMMFFQDEYFSIGQSWIIIIIFSVTIMLIGNHADSLTARFLKIG